MNADSAFYTGKSHKVCQDYATHGILPDGLAYAIVSDGCSGAPDTDFGSRLLVKAAEKCIREGVLFDDSESSQVNFFTTCVVEANAWRMIIGLPEFSLDATLLVVLAGAETFQIAIHGDGCAAMKHKNGDLELYSIDYDRSAPYYPSYRLNRKRDESFALARQIKTVKRQVIKTLSKPTDKEDLIRNKEIEYFSGLVSNYQWVGVTSDGLTTLMEICVGETSKSTRMCSLEQSARGLLDFKHLNGEFVLRGTKFWIDQLSRSNTMYYFDDVSVAAVAL